MTSGSTSTMMGTMEETGSAIEIEPLTPDRWEDAVVVFGSGRGVCSKCWCMYWRLPRHDFEQSLGETNRKLFRARIDTARITSSKTTEQAILRVLVSSWFDSAS